MTFQALGMFVCEWKGFSALHSHRLIFLPSLGSVWRYWIPLNSEGVEVISNTQWPWPDNNGHTHFVMFWVSVAPPPTPSHVDQVMNCFPHSQCLACAVASPDSRRPLGTALLPFSLAPNTQLHSLCNLHNFSPFSLQLHFLQYSFPHYYIHTGRWSVLITLTQICGKIYDVDEKLTRQTDM